MRRGRIVSAQKIIQAREGPGVEAVDEEGEEKIVIMPPTETTWK